MSQTQTSQAQPGKLSRRTYVSLHALDDGSVAIVATGKNGSLSLVVGGKEEGPSMALVDLDSPAPGISYRGYWSLTANGRLKGWLVDNKGEYKWFPERAKRKLPAKRRQAAKSVRKGG